MYKTLRDTTAKRHSAAVHFALARARRYDKITFRPWCLGFPESVILAPQLSRWNLVEQHCTTPSVYDHLAPSYGLSPDGILAIKKRGNDIMAEISGSLNAPARVGPPVSASGEFSQQPLPSYIFFVWVRYTTSEACSCCVFRTEPKSSE